MSAVEIRSLQDARELVRRLSSRNAEENAAVRFWRLCKRATLLAVLAGAFLIYYFLSVSQQILEMPNAPAPAVNAQHAPAPGGLSR